MRSRLRLLLAMVGVCLSPTVFSQISIPLNTIVTENFTSLGTSATASLPAGWRLSPGGNTVGGWSAGVTSTTQAATGGTPSTGGRYNWGTTTGTDRAVGFLTDAGYNAPNAVMAYFRNTTGATVNTVTISFAVERYVVNTGSFSLSFASSTDGSTWTAQPAGDIASGMFAGGAASGTFSNPQSLGRTLTVNVTVPANGDIYFRWTFATTNTGSQGVGLDNVSVYAGAATPVLNATLKDYLHVDNGMQNQFNEGDVIRYQTVIKNTGSGAATGVQINIPPPSNTTLVPGSIKTSAVAVDDKYATSFNTVLNGASVLANDFGVPAPTAILSYGPTTNATLYSPGAAGTTDAGGSITLAANGTFSYTSPANFSGVDGFQYITGNGNLPNNDAVVSITVAPDITITSIVATNISCKGGANGSITITAAGGAGTLQYSINGAAGPYQASAVFSGLSIGTYNVVVKDAVGYTKAAASSTVLTEPAAIVVSGTISNGVYNTALSASTFTKTGGTGTATWSATGLPTGISINGSTGAVSGTPTATGSFTAVITATDANGCTGSKAITFTIAPNLSNDTYTAVGNTQLVADGHSAPASAFVSNATNIRTNDQSDVAVTVTGGTFTTTNGGSLVIDAAGKFTYTPALNSTTADSYTYTATANGVSATATISFTVSNMVWYVNNTYGGGNGASDGRSHRPFTTANAAATASAANETIYVHTGSGNTTGDILLKSGQTLRGAGSALNIGNLSIAAGTKPTLSGMLTLAASVTADGFDMNTGGNNALLSTGATAVNVSIGNITTSGAATPVSITNTTGTIAIAGGSLTGGAGTVFAVSGGSATVSCGAAISQATTSQRLVNLSGITGGSITLSGNLSSTGSGTGINVASNTGGIIVFSGGIKTLATGGNTAVTLSSNTGATVNFSGGGLAVTTTSGGGVNVTGGGTVNITGANNTITTTTGVAVNIQNTTIGASGITLKSVSSNGAANGIYLASTGSAGSFTVSGDGTAWGSGGTIQNSSGADGATAGNGIYLNNAYNVAFNFMLLNGHANNGLYGTGVRGFTLSKTRFTGTHGTSNSGIYDESAVNLVNLGGAVSIKNSYFSGGAYNTILMENISGTSPVITSLQMDADTLTGMQGSTSDVRSTALLVNLTDGSLANATIQNCRIDSWWGNAIHVLSQGTASAIITISNNYCNNTNGALAGAGGIWVAGGTLDYTIAGNTVLNTNGTAISADRSNAGSTMRGLITGNNVGASGQANSGSFTGIAIFASHHGAGTTLTTISNNTIRQVNGSASGAITALMGDDVGFGDAGGGAFNVSILNNNIQESGTTVNNAQHGILLTIGVTSSGSTGGDNGVGCFNLQGNVITNFISGTATNRIRVNQRFKTTARFPGYTGAAGDNTALQNYLAARNTASTFAIVNNTTFPGPGFSNTPGGVPCSQ